MPISIYISHTYLLNFIRQQPDGEEDITKPKPKSLLRDVSHVDMMGRLKKRGSQRSLSGDNSVSSRLSDFLKRDDSVCSNLSEFANSECSEFSLDLSIKDESIANQTITSLADIEDELNTLKSSVLEIDEEFLKFASKPNPYLLKTTFSDHSIESSDSRPHSSLELISGKVRMNTRSSSNENNFDHKLDASSLAASDDLSSACSNDKEKSLHSEIPNLMKLSRRKEEKKTLELNGFQNEKIFLSKGLSIYRRSSIESALKPSTQVSVKCLIINVKRTFPRRMFKIAPAV